MWKVIFLSLVSAFLVANVSAACLTDTTRTGAEVTYYGAYTGGGHCSLDGPVPPAGTASGIYATVAIADNIYQNSAACGMCIEITRKATDPGSGASPLPAGTYTVFVNNQCPSCKDNGIDLGLNGDGIWNVNWKPVPCPVGTSKLQYKFQGSNPYYLKVQVRNSRYPIKSFEVKQGSTYIALSRQPDFFFITQGTSVSFPVVFPLTVRITSTTGDVVEDSIASLADDVIFTGGQQFPDCTSGSGSAATTGTKATTAAATTGVKTATTGTKSTSAAATTGVKTATTGVKSTTGKSATSTTGKSSTSGGSTSGSSSTGSYTNIFMNGFENSFEDWSWASGRNAADSNAYSGVGYSFASKAWEALYFHCSSSKAGCIDSSKHSAVEFYFKSPVEAKDKVLFAFVQGNSGVNAKTISTYVSGSTTSWVKVTVPVNSGIYDGIWWQSNVDISTAYVDSIRLINK